MLKYSYNNISLKPDCISVNTDRSLFFLNQTVFSGYEIQLRRLFIMSSAVFRFYQTSQKNLVWINMQAFD